MKSLEHLPARGNLGQCGTSRGIYLKNELIKLDVHVWMNSGCTYGIYWFNVVSANEYINIMHKHA